MIARETRYAARMSEAWHLRCLYCGAEESVGAAQCPRCHADVGIIPCASCKAWVQAGADACPMCKAAMPKAATAADLKCPRCPGALGVVALGSEGVRVHRCALCFGCFIEVQDVATLEGRVEKGEALPMDQLVPPAGKTLPAQEVLPLVSCPICKKQMDRARFDGRSVAVVDICTMHGLWLDAGEMVTVLDYIRERLNDGGTVPETAAEKKEEAAFEQNMARISASNREIEGHLLGAAAFDPFLIRPATGSRGVFGIAASAAGRLIFNGLRK
jgi:Zn-finger nucleic acid-binding protein